MVGTDGGPSAVVTRPRGQFYVTHCAKSDSVLGDAGWSVRASSADKDDLLVRLALECPPYELPMDMWAKMPSRKEAPRRLARTNGPDGGVWVVHSAYLEKDTMNRDGSYFSHVLFLPAEEADPKAVLETWAAGWWRTDYDPGAAQKLPLPDKLERGARVGDDALVAFLADGRGPAAPPGPEELATVVCPERLRGDAALRRALLDCFLRGLMRVAELPEKDARARLFVHAEPGLLALLLYGAVRLLPQGWVRDLTFTTFEPAHRGLKDYRDALVVGTYLGGPDKPLDPDLTSTRGFALNTFKPDGSSPELRPSSDSQLGELLALVAVKKWGVIDEARAAIEREPPRLERLPKVLALSAAAARLRATKETTEDLLDLKLEGHKVLVEMADYVRERVVVVARDDPRVWGPFTRLLRDQLDTRRQRAAVSLKAGKVEEWAAWWAVVCGVTDSGGLREQTRRLLDDLRPEAGELPPPARAALRPLARAAGEDPLSAFYLPVSTDDLADVLDDPECPTEVYGNVAFAVMAGEDRWLPAPGRQHLVPMRGLARSRLLAAPENRLKAYFGASKRHPGTMPNCVQQLFHPYAPECQKLLAWLIRTGNQYLNPATWHQLIERLNLYRAPAWKGFLHQDDRLAELLVSLGDDRKAEPIWEYHLGLLNKELLTGADEVQAEVAQQLRKAVRRLKAERAEKAPVRTSGAKLTALMRLLDLWDDPLSAMDATAQRLAAAFRLFGCPELLEGLSLLFKQTYAGGDPRDAADPLEPFAELFNSLYEADTTDAVITAGCLKRWHKVVRTAPPETRPAFRVYYIERYIDESICRAVLNTGEVNDLTEDVTGRLKEKAVESEKNVGRGRARKGGRAAKPRRPRAPRGEADWKIGGRRFVLGVLGTCIIIVVGVVLALRALR